MTPSERDYTKKLIAERKKRNESLSAEDKDKYVWVIRGNQLAKVEARRPT
jgi:hypothetical protein